MAEVNQSLIKLTQDDKRRISNVAGYLTLITKANEAYAKSKIKDVIEAALPWSKCLAESFGIAAAPLKLLNFVLEKASKDTDPIILGHLACTLAYEEAIKHTIEWTAGPEGLFEESKAQLLLLQAENEVDISTFKLDSPLDHEFTKQAERRLQAAALIVGYTNAQIESLTGRVRERFPVCLSKVLTDGDKSKKFEPFRHYLQLGVPQLQRSYSARQKHLKYQQWLYEEAPVLGESPFALSDIYVEAECGDLTWGQIHESRMSIKNKSRTNIIPINPFVESNYCGGRKDALKTVMEYIADLSLKEAIIIQGVPGAGKSCFTLRLCAALRQEQMYPIWIRLKELDLSRNIADALPKAVRLSDDDRAIDDIFDNGAIFAETGLGRFEKVSRYVLILDGWDEISISDEGFQKRVNRMLDQVSNTYLARNPPVRIILTGRPSTEVTENTAILRDRTPILTLRPFRPANLEHYIKDLAQAVSNRPIDIDNDSLDSWQGFDPSKFDPLIERYQDEYGKMLDAAETGSLTLLGWPLLAHLTVRLISRWDGDPESLLKDTTTLYRNLVNLTCSKAGKSPDSIDGADEMRGQQRIVGDGLRALLQQTASAMSILGGDIITKEELSVHLKSPDATTDELINESMLAALMVSFYFKGGFEHLGCEFADRSFREYLFAEAIIEILKWYGHDTATNTAPLEERKEYWRDFVARDTRYQFSRKLSEMLAPQWLSPEVAKHLERLIEWEIARVSNRTPPIDAGRPTESLDMEGWRRVRDALADLWDWWGDGVHLRSQQNSETFQEFNEPYVCKLTKHSVPLTSRNRNIKPARTATLDAHLGDGLCRICALVHYQVAISEGWLTILNGDLNILPRPDQLWEGTSGTGRPSRRYQYAPGQDCQSWILFAPSGESPTYFANYIHRINAAGWRPKGSFPSGVTLAGVYLREAHLYGLNLTQANLQYANLEAARLSGSNLDGVILIGANLAGASLANASMDGAIFDGAILVKAMLTGASIVRGSFARCSLREANLQRARLDNAILSDTLLKKASFESASLAGANLVGANLFKVNFDLAKLDGADLSHVRHCKREQFEISRIDEFTKLPPKLEALKRGKLQYQPGSTEMLLTQQGEK